MSDAKITLSAEDKTRAAFASAKRNVLDLQDSARAINQSFGGLGAVLGSAFAGLSLTAFFKSTADGIDRLNDLKDATGASIENISGLEDVAARTGTSFDAMSTALVKFNGVLNAAATDAGQANIFKSLGLDVEALRRADPAEALRLTAVALARYADDGNKARVVQELFGRSIREVAPLLNDLAQTGQLNAKVTKEQAEEAERFNKQLFELSKNSTDFARSIVSDVVPALANFFQQIVAINKAGGFFTSIGKQFKVEVASDELTLVVKQIEQLQASIDRQGSDSALDKRMKGLRDRAAALSKEVSDATGWLKRFSEAANPYVDEAAKKREDRGFVPALQSINVPKPPAKAADGPKVKPPELIVTPIPDSLKDALRLIEQSDSSKLADLNLQLAELLDLGRDGQASAGVYQAITGVLEQIGKLDPAYQQALADAKRFNEILAQTPNAELARARADMQLLAKAYQDGKFGLEGSQEAIEAYGQAVRAALGTAKDEVTKNTNELDELAKQAARNIQDALGSTLRKTLAGDFDSIGELWGNLLLDMASQAAAAQIGKFLLGDFGSSGNVGGLFGDVLGFVLGAGKATGGPVGAHSIQRVNERGFEVFTDARGDNWLMTGARGGTVTPNDKLRAASGGATTNQVVNITNNVGGGMQRGEVYSLLQMAMSQMRSDTVKLLRDNRLLAT